jgi:hypothetical protein
VQFWCTGNFDAPETFTGNIARMRWKTCTFRHSDAIAPDFDPKNAARELPWKTIAKSFASLVTYPHSEAKRFENRPSRDQT